MLAGIVITKDPVDTYVPLYVREGNISTQFIMTTLEELGLLKMDFLGLRTLTVIKDTIDLVKKEELLSLIKLYSEEYNFVGVLPISAIKQDNTEKVLEEIEKNLKTGPAYYNTEEYTDQTMRQLVEETIREKALKLLDEEIPHGIYVEIEKMKMSKAKIDNKPFYNIEATIYCLRNSHKGIIIGKGGQMLKKTRPRKHVWNESELKNMGQSKRRLARHGHNNKKIQTKQIIKK